MAKIDAIEQRLLNWARWKVSRGSGALGYAAVNHARVEQGVDRYREAIIPITDCDAEQTDNGVKSLGEPLVRTLDVVYVHGGSSEWKQRQLGCGAAAIKARVWESHRRLAWWFTEQAELARRRQAAMQVSQTR